MGVRRVYLGKSVGEWISCVGLIKSRNEMEKFVNWVGKVIFPGCIECLSALLTSFLWVSVCIKKCNTTLTCVTFLFTLLLSETLANYFRVFFIFFIFHFFFVLFCFCLFILNFLRERSFIYYEHSATN